MCSKFLSFICIIGSVNSIMIKKECPMDEMHKSCSFYEEYTCWASEDRLGRVKLVPPRLPHCRSGCYCTKGFVREFPGGPCIPAAGCQDQALKKLLENLPTLFRTLS